PFRAPPTAAATWGEAPTTSAPAPAAGTEAPTTGRQTVSLSATGENLTVGPQTPLVLDNEALRVEFNSAGHVRSLRDLAGDRELLPAGQALGVLTLFRDQPVMWDAWDVDRHVLQMPKPLNRGENITASTGEDGSASVRATYTDGTSTFTLTDTLRPGAAEWEMGAEGDWYTREHLLKEKLPVEVRAEHAAYETQYGYVQRPISTNACWDEADFDVSQHRYLHVAEPGYGIGVVNDSSYGCDVTRIEGGGTMVRLSLLRGARYPDPHTD